ncbi:unnamed protein product [Agarophyton chilense]
MSLKGHRDSGLQTWELQYPYSSALQIGVQRVRQHPYLRKCPQLVFIPHFSRWRFPIVDLQILSCATSSKSARRAARRKPNGYWKDIANIQKELLEFSENNIGSEPYFMPSAKLLREGGRRDLDNAITNFGGYRKVGQVLGWSSKHKKKVSGYWDDFSNLREELLAFTVNSPLKLAPGTMPTLKQLRMSRRSDLVGAIAKHDGISAVASNLRLRRVVESKPRMYWSDWKTIETEVMAFLEKRSEPKTDTGGSKKRRVKRNKMPSLRELRAAGKGDLAEGIKKYHGGFRAVAKKLNLVSKKTDFYYEQFYNLAKELYRFVDGHGVDGIMPSSSILRTEKRTDLAVAIVKFGGMSKVSTRLGLHHRIRAKEDYKNWALFRTSLLAFIKAYCNDAGMPSSTMLQQCGRDDLCRGIFYHGGSTTVAERMGLKRNYWQEFYLVGYELLCFIDVHGTEGVMPTETDFLLVGRKSLSVAVAKFGQSHVASRLGLREQTKEKNFRLGDTKVAEDNCE